MVQRVSLALGGVKRSERVFLLATARAICLGLLAIGAPPQLALAAGNTVRMSSTVSLLPLAGERIVVLPAVVLPATVFPAAVIPVPAIGIALAEALRPGRADFAAERASRDARFAADWVVDSADNRGMPFVIVDKVDARVFVFDAQGRLQGAAPALLGLAVGDDSSPGIGDRKLSDIRPAERTTPAGRFLAALGRNAHGEEILWVDYDTAISMHRVITTSVKDRRAQRLASASPLDNRISFGCINLPVKFYENVLSPAFTGTDGIVYVLPEVRSMSEVFGSYDVEARARLQLAGQLAAEKSGAPAGITGL